MILYLYLFALIQDKITRLITFKIVKPIIAFNRWVDQFACEFKEYFTKLPINSRVIIFIMKQQWHFNAKKYAFVGTVLKIQRKLSQNRNL